MAYNSVPLGQAGTGSAFILGDDTASTNFNRNLQAQNSFANQQRLEKERQAQLLAKSYRDNLLAASDGKLFAKQLGDLEQQHLKQGMEYRGQGFDIYNPDPNNPKQLEASQQYMSDRRMIENLRSYRKGIEDKYKENSTLLSKAQAGEYNQEDIAKMNELATNGNIVDLYNSGGSLPELRKNFNLRDELKGITAPTFNDKRTVNGMIVDKKFIDKNDAENVVLGTLSNSPVGQAELQRVTQGMPIGEIRRLPSTEKEIRDVLLKDANGDPELKLELARNQIKVGTPAFDKWADSEAKRLHGVKKDFTTLLNNGVAQISQGADLFDKREAEMTAYQRQSLALQREREARIASGGGSGDDDVYYTNDFMDRIFKGARGEHGGEGSGEQLGAILDGKGFNNNWKLPGSDKTQTKPYHVQKFVDTQGKPTGKIKISVAPREITSTNADGEQSVKILPSRFITINAKDEETERSKLNSFLKEVTGGSLGVKESQIRTNKASGKGEFTPQATTAKQQPAKTVPVSKIKSLVGKKGYEGYTEKELIDYYKSQGYTIK